MDLQFTKTMFKIELERLMELHQIKECIVVTRFDERGAGNILHMHAPKSRPQLIEVVKRLQNDIQFTNPN